MDNNELIRLRAYEIWIREGQPDGRELEHWLTARRDILGTRAEQRDENPVAQDNAQQPSDPAKLREATELG